jgi:hypothetical protein
MQHRDEHMSEENASTRSDIAHTRVRARARPKMTAPIDPSRAEQVRAWLARAAAALAQADDLARDAPARAAAASEARRCVRRAREWAGSGKGVPCSYAPRSTAP